MEPYHINVRDEGASAKISKNKRRKLQKYGGIKTSEPETKGRLRETLKTEIPYFRGAFGDTSYIWRKLEQNAKVYRKERR